MWPSYCSATLFTATPPGFWNVSSLNAKAIHTSYLWNLQTFGQRYPSRRGFVSDRPFIHLFSVANRIQQTRRFNAGSWFTSGVWSLIEWWVVLVSVQLIIVYLLQFACVCMCLRLRDSFVSVKLRGEVPLKGKGAFDLVSFLFFGFKTSRAEMCNIFPFRPFLCAFFVPVRKPTHLRID